MGIKWPELVLLTIRGEFKLKHVECGSRQKWMATVTLLGILVCSFRSSPCTRPESSRKIEEDEHEDTDEKQEEENSSGSELSEVEWSDLN